jgi:predicted transcriptional regulator/ABC-type dipeptide/oligopeptide/nickel transport system ATPase component
MPTQIDITNPNTITYITEELGFTILGGIRMDGLDRLRVTIRIEVINRKFEHYMNNADLAALPLNHNLDLYNDVQVEKLIRKAAERLEVGTLQITKSIADITRQLELYRLQQIEQQQTAKEVKKKILTTDEREEAINFLMQPKLMQRTGEAIGKAGVIGEAANRLLMYVIFTSRKRESPLHVISFGSSGAGKSHLQEKVAELIPEEDKIESTSLTSNALYYFGEYDLQHKLILIEDMDGAETVMYALRELISKKYIIKMVPLKDTKGVTRTITFKVKGPVTVAGCTTQESIYEDNANRSFLIYIDESKAQDEHIMNYQRKKSAGTINSEEEKNIKALLQNTQRLLQPIAVRNPYAEQLQIPTEVFKPRRTNAHYLQFIEAVTFYHQYQREKHTDKQTGETYISTTLEDIEEANKLMKEVLLRKADELSGATRNYFEQLKALLQEQKQSTFTNKGIRKKLRLPGTTVRRYHNELLQSGYVKLQESKKQSGYLFEIVSYEEYVQLQNRIASVLDNIVNNLNERGATEPPVSQKINGSIKRKLVKPSTSVSQ